MRQPVYLSFLLSLSFVVTFPVQQQQFSLENLFVPQQRISYVGVIQDGKPTLGDIIPTEKSLGTFLDALMRFPDLANAVFNVENELTVVAPVNSAFQKYDIVDRFDDLHEIVASHIITKKVTKDSLKESVRLPTLNQNQSIIVSKVDGEWVLNHKARFLEGMKEASNGNLYRIDTILP